MTGVDGACVPPDAVWFKSSRSGAGSSNCVQVAVLPDDLFGIRDSKAVPDAPVLVIASHSFRQFIAATKSGAFDIPADLRQLGRAS